MYHVADFEIYPVVDADAERSHIASSLRSIKSRLGLQDIFLSLVITRDMGRYVQEKGLDLETGDYEGDLEDGVDEYEDDLEELDENLSSVFLVALVRTASGSLESFEEAVVREMQENFPEPSASTDPPHRPWSKYIGVRKVTEHGFKKYIYEGGLPPPESMQPLEES